MFFFTFILFMDSNYFGLPKKIPFVIYSTINP